MRPLFPVFLIVLVDVFGLTLMLPLLPFYAEHFGASPLVATSLAASFAVCQLISGPILGRLSDKIGRKPVLIASQIGTLIGFLVIGSATSLWMLFLGRIIDGTTAGNLSIAQAYISDVTKPEERTKAFGMIFGIAFGAGFLFGPAVSGLMAEHYGYESPAYAAAAASFVSIILTWRLLPAVKPTPSEVGPRRALMFRFLQMPLARRRFIEYFCFVLSFSTLVGGLALYLERQFGFTVKNAGYVYAYSGLIGILIQGGMIGRLVKKLGEPRLALAGFATMAIGYGMLGWAMTLPILLVLTAISSFGSAVTRPAITTLITKSVGRDEQGAALGLSQSMSSVAQIAGPLIAGALIEVRALHAYGLVAAGFAVVGAVLLLIGGVGPDPALVPGPLDLPAEPH